MADWASAVISGRQAEGGLQFVGQGYGRKPGGGIQVVFAGLVNNAGHASEFRGRIGEEFIDLAAFEGGRNAVVAEADYVLNWGIHWVSGGVIFSPVNV